MKDPNSKALGKIIFIFAVCMFLGALISWVWIPGVQERAVVDGVVDENVHVKKGKLRTKTLEELGGGRACVGEEERVGIRAAGRGFRKRVKRRRGR